MLRGGYESYHFKRTTKRTRGYLYFFFKLILLTVILYTLVATLFIFTIRIDSVSMVPAIMKNDRVLASPIVYGVKIPFSENKLLDVGSPQRGDLVVLVPPQFKRLSPLQGLMDFGIRFFTLQGYGLKVDGAGWRSRRYVVKRIIGIPGDTIRMDNFVAFIKAEDKAVFRRETDLISRKYEVRIEKKEQEWQDALPFAGNMGELQLKEHEYFVLGDNRCHSSDSLSWGQIRVNRVIAKVFLRYWPISKIGDI